MSKKKLTVIADNENPVPFEVMEKQIVEIGSALAKIAKTRVSRKLVVALIQDDTKLGKGLIETVLDSYDSLESKYLRKKL